MENETRLTIRLPEDLLEAVKAKAEKKNLTVSSLVRKFFLAYISDEDEAPNENSNSIYSYQDIAKKKRELKEAVKQAHEAFNEAQRDYSNMFVNRRTRESIFVESARDSWKGAVAAYNRFCAECKQNKFNLEEK